MWQKGGPDGRHGARYYTTRERFLERSWCTIHGQELVSHNEDITIFSLPWFERDTLLGGEYYSESNIIPMHVVSVPIPRQCQLRTFYMDL